MIEGARPSEMPGFIKPQLATLKSRAPIGDQWLHEIKYDGYRIQIHLSTPFQSKIVGSGRNVVEPRFIAFNVLGHRFSM
jgi:bifunctional non-homologous end joining protein LigD